MIWPTRCDLLPQHYRIEDGACRNAARPDRGGRREPAAVTESGSPMDASATTQKTLKHPIRATGIGLHSGIPVTMRLCPAAPGTGIRFRRTDVTGVDPVVPARWDRVADTRLCTLLANADGVSVGTVEHLMAALVGCEIDNLEVEIDGPEVPVMDGSSAPFVFLVDCAGIVEQDAPRRVLRVLKSVSVSDGDRAIRIDPAPAFSVTMCIDFAHVAVGRQEKGLTLVNGTFRRELASARTFGFLDDIERLRALGLARGGSLDNAIVIGRDGVLNAEGTRFPDEFVRHKILDCVGDLSLAGAPIMGMVTASRSGHEINNRLLHALFADPAAWRFEPAQVNGGGIALLGRSAAEPA